MYTFTQLVCVISNFVLIDILRINSVFFFFFCETIYTRLIIFILSNNKRLIVISNDFSPHLLIEAPGGYIVGIDRVLSWEIR